VQVITFVPFLRWLTLNKFTSRIVDKSVLSNKLGILEEDDEFEEFPVEGIILACLLDFISNSLTFLLRLDWDDGATANKIELSAAFTEDWDDQTVEDDFSNQLRAELKNLSKSN